MKEVMFKMGRFLKRLGYLPIKVLLATSVIILLLISGIVVLALLLLFLYTWVIQSLFRDESVISKVEEFFNNIGVAFNKYSGGKNE